MLFFRLHTHFESDDLAPTFDSSILSQDFDAHPLHFYRVVVAGSGLISFKTGLDLRLRWV